MDQIKIVDSNVYLLFSSFYHTKLSKLKHFCSFAFTPGINLNVMLPRYLSGSVKFHQIDRRQKKVPIQRKTKCSFGSTNQENTNIYVSFINVSKE